MISDITQNISPVTALPDLLAENRPAAVNTLVEEELPNLSIELESLITELNTFIDETNATADMVEQNAISAEDSAILANALANFQGAWSSIVTYSKGKSVESTTGSKIYYTSKVDNNLNHAVTDTNYWLYNPINDKLDKDTTNLTAKTTPIDADVVLMGDSAASNVTKKLTWANLKATILSSFGAMIATLTAKTTPADADGFIIADSAVSNASKFLSLQNLKATIFGSPILTGNPTAPTQTAQNNSTRLATTAYVDGKFVRGTAVNSTSGTSIDFTGIPSWVKRITIIFNGVSTSGTAWKIIQVGSGSISTTGYVSTGASVSAAPASTNASTGFIIQSILAADTISGTLTITNISGNLWICNHSAKSSTSTACVGGGDITLAGVLDRLRITTSNGTDTFDAGSINIMYEG